MIYLIIAIICSAMFSVTFKLCRRKDSDAGRVILINYLTAFLFFLIPILTNVAAGVPVSDYRLGVSTTLLTIPMGILFMLGFIVMDWSTGHNGVALTTTAARAALIIPVVLCFLFLSQPEPSWIGVILILGAMALIVLPTEKNGSSGQSGKAGAAAIIALIAVFFAYGISDFMLKVVQKAVADANAGNPEIMDRQLSMLTCSIFFMSALSSLVTCLINGSFKKNPFNWSNLSGGVKLGLFNCGCTWGILKALGEMPTGTFYPLYNIGIVILATLIGVIAFKEKLHWRQIAGLALAVLAIVLVF